MSNSTEASDRLAIGELIDAHTHSVVRRNLDEQDVRYGQDGKSH
jgi:hypothetical protein